MTVTLRAPHPDDIPALTALVNLPGVRWGTMRLPLTSERFVRDRVEGTNPNVHSVVAVVDGTAIGWASLVRGVGRGAHTAGIGVSVHDDHTGRGIGGQMLDALIDLADNWLGLRRLWLNVMADNLPAIRLYQSRGFQREGIKRGDVLRDGALIDSHLMARLAPAPERMPDA